MQPVLYQPENDAQPAPRAMPRCGKAPGAKSRSPHSRLLVSDRILDNGATGFGEPGVGSNLFRDPMFGWLAKMLKTTWVDGRSQRQACIGSSQFDAPP
jgi:hypothetical protein